MRLGQTLYFASFNGTMCVYMKNFFYILKCSDGTFYSGATKDLNKRLEIHNSGKGAKYTRGRLPVTLLYSEKFKTFGKALSREAEVKRFSRLEKQDLIAKKK